MYKYRFSIFTATYNRAKTLPKVYDSLVKQKFKNFEWIVIDDGSKDNTEDIIKSYQIEGELKSIRYIKKENGGKHTAWREATKLFEGKYIVTLDSDDFLLPDTLEIFDRHWKELENSSNYDEFWEVKSRTLYEDGTLVGKPLSKPVVDAYSKEFTLKNSFFSELDACRKVEILREEAKVPDSFLYEENCSNFPEVLRWFRAGKLYKTRYIEEKTTVYVSIEGERLTSAAKGKHKRNTKLTYNNLVYALYSLSESGKEMLKWNKKLFMRDVALLLYSCFALRINPFKIPHKELYSSNNCFFMILGYLPIYILYLIRG